MAASDDPDTSQTSVTTYIPTSQKEVWQTHADKLDMSQSEFIRTMVQAGRRSFSIPDSPVSGDAEPVETSTGSDSSESDATDNTDGHGSADFEQRVLDVLESKQCLSWDELLDAVTDNIEDQLEETLQHLQADNRVQYSGRQGGYTLTED